MPPPVGPSEGTSFVISGIVWVDEESMSAGMVIAVGKVGSIHRRCWNREKKVLSSGEVEFETGADCVVDGNTGKSGIALSNASRGGCWNNTSGGEFDREFGAVALVCRGVCHRPAELGVVVWVEVKNMGTESID